jgi:hypothetical protein
MPEHPDSLGSYILLKPTSGSVGRTDSVDVGYKCSSCLVAEAGTARLRTVDLITVEWGRQYHACVSGRYKGTLFKLLATAIELIQCRFFWGRKVVLISSDKPPTQVLLRYPTSVRLRCTRYKGCHSRTEATIIRERGNEEVLDRDSSRCTGGMNTADMSTVLQVT